MGSPQEGPPRSQARCRALPYKRSPPRVCMAQIIKRHDVDSAVKILLKNAGPVFKEQVVKWGAVHAEKRRCAPHALSCQETLMSEFLAELVNFGGASLICPLGMDAVPCAGKNDVSQPIVSDLWLLGLLMYGEDHWPRTRRNLGIPTIGLAVWHIHGVQPSCRAAAD